MNTCISITSLTDEVSNIKILVSSDNSVKVGTMEPVTISAGGR